MALNDSGISTSSQPMWPAIVALDSHQQLDGRYLDTDAVTAVCGRQFN